MYFRRYINNVFEIINNCEITDEKGTLIPTEDGFNKWFFLTCDVYNSGKTIYFIGNGASAAMAGHSATDACKNGGLKARSFNDTALLTSISDNFSYEAVFSQLLEEVVFEGDLLVTISSSGNSPNIVFAIDSAKKLRMNVITLSAFSPENKSRLKGHLNFYVPAKTYGHAEVAHQLILHCWLDYFVEKRRLNTSKQ